MRTETMWVIIGYTGQAIFTARFMAQWVASISVAGAFT